MNDPSFSEEIAYFLPFDLTPAQEEATECLSLFFADQSPYTVCLIKGYAGTGKTALLGALCQVLLRYGAEVRLLAPTGRAARRLSQTANLAAYTIHRAIYRATAAMVEEGGSFSRAKGGRAGTVFIVDEASMIGAETKTAPSSFGSGDLLADLLAYVHNTDGGRVIFVGDTAQLPPVGTVLSPALNGEYLEHRYDLTVYESTLTDVVRQTLESGILMNATRLRQLLSLPAGDEIAIRLSTHFADVRTISGADLVDLLDEAYREYGCEEVMVVCYSNKRSLSYNLGIRGQVLWRESEIERGDRLVVSRNNYAYCKRRDRADFLANGDIVEVRRLGRTYEFYGHRFVDAEIYVEDRDEELEVCLLLDTLASESPQLTGAEREAFYHAVVADYQDEVSIPKRRALVRQNRFWQALEVKYAYALTCHKAQGGQWQAVFVDMGLMSLIPTDESLIRWLYTAITRAETKLFLVNTPEAMLEAERN